MESYNRSMQVCRSYYWTRHGGNTNISKECGLSMLGIALWETAAKEKRFILLLGTCKVGSGVLGPVDNGRFCLD